MATRQPPAWVEPRLHSPGLTRRTDLNRSARRPLAPARNGTHHPTRPAAGSPRERKNTLNQSVLAAGLAQS
eukprot:10710577-Alexandrium_andersonii.AAC.1